MTVCSARNPENGKLIVVKDGRFGPYVQEVEAEEPKRSTRPRCEVVEAPKKRGAKKEGRAQAPHGIALPLDVGRHHRPRHRAAAVVACPRRRSRPATGEEITAQNGRFGPYLKKGTDSRSLDSETQIFDITLEDALAKYAEPKYGARRATERLKEFDADPSAASRSSSRTVASVRTSPTARTNATVPRGEDAMAITFERAVELIADKRAKGPAPKRTAAKKTTTTRKAPAKKS